MSGTERRRVRARLGAECDGGSTRLSHPRGSDLAGTARAARTRRGRRSVQRSPLDRLRDDRGGGAWRHVRQHLGDGGAG